MIDTYEKKYKEANDKVAARFGTNIAKEIFADLYESEDEKIRKELIDFLKDWNTLSTKKFIAWLEKQDKSDKIVEKAKIEKQRVLVTESDGSANIDWDTRSLQDVKLLLECGLDYINKLEKQGGQEVNEPDWCHHKVDLSDCSEEYRKAYYDGWNNCNQQHSQCNAEQKLANKIEPKFKIGKWVISTLPGIKYPHLITDIKDGYYIFEEDNDHAHIASNDSVLKLWTIQDAKPGDVLAEDSCIFIIKELNYDLTAKTYCCLYDDGDFELNSNLYFDDTCTYPATKEQRDLLFQKMEESGYEWDAEKKELKKIEQNWSEEDKRMLDCALDMVEWYSGKNEDKSRLVSDWLKTLRPQPKWTEEDERMFKSLNKLLNEASCYSCTEGIDKIIAWLKQKIGE